jgi:hypothetical protein
VSASAELLAPSVGQNVFISSRSVYPMSAVDADESCRLLTLDDRADRAGHR